MLTTRRSAFLLGVLALSTLFPALHASADQASLHQRAQSLDLVEEMSPPHVRGQTTGDVAIRDNSYDPDTIEIEPGGTVVWTHEGQAPHSVTADDGSFDSSPNCQSDTGAGCMQNGDTYEQTFDQAGRFEYHCKIHGSSGGGGMAGVVVVQDPGEEPPIGEGSEGTSAEPTEELAEALGDQLPATGAAPTAPLVAGLALVGAGSAAVILSRLPARRRSLRSPVGPPGR